MSDDLVAELRKEPRIEPFSNQGEPDYRASLEHRAADELDRLQAENERLQEALERADVTIKTADALAEGVGLMISTADPRIYLQAVDGVRVSHDAYRKSRAALQDKGDE